MKISNTSWHYRFNKLVQQEKFTDRAECGRFTTCSYIRTTIASMFKGAFNCLLVVVLSMLIAWLALSALIVPFYIWLSSSIPQDIFMVPCVLIWCIAVLGLVIALGKQIKERLEEKFEGYQPNVFVQAIKDNHNKFCTRVEVV